MNKVVNVGDEISLFVFCDKYFYTAARSTASAFKILRIKDCKNIDLNGIKSSNFLFTGKVVFIDKSVVLLEFIDVYPENHKYLEHFRFLETDDETEELAEYTQNHPNIDNVFQFDLHKVNKNFYYKNDKELEKLFENKEKSLKNKFTFIIKHLLTWI